MNTSTPMAWLRYGACVAVGVVAGYLLGYSRDSQLAAAPAAQLRAPPPAFEPVAEEPPAPSLTEILSNPGFLLVGTYIPQDPAAAKAWLQSPDSEEIRAYAKSETLDGGYTLTEIYTDSVELSRDGQHYLIRRSAKSSPASEPPVAGTPYTAPAASTAKPAPLSSMFARPSAGSFGKNRKETSNPATAAASTGTAGKSGTPTASPPPQGWGQKRPAGGSPPRKPHRSPFGGAGTDVNSDADAQFQEPVPENGLEAPVPEPQP